MKKQKISKSPKKQRNLIALIDWNKHHDFPSQVQLRNARQHHLAGIGDYKTFPFVKAFRRVYIDEEKFFEWAEETAYIFRKPQ